MLTRYVRPSSVGLALAMVTGLGGCGTQPDDAVTETTAPLYEATGVTLFTANANVAHVCFITVGTGPDLAAGKQIVKDAINNAWARHSGLRFEGFEECSNPTSKMLTWQVSQGTTPGSWGGRTAIGMGARLGDIPTAQIQQTFAPGNNMTASVAVHEVGHAIGWVHEHQRPDRPDISACVKALNLDPTSGDTAINPNGIMLTAYDPESIMNYCRDRNHDGVPDVTDDPTLSALDIVGVQLAYGRPAPGAIVGLSNECLEASSSAIGALVRTDNCKGTAAQQWLRDSSFHLVSVGFSGRILETASSNPVSLGHSPIVTAAPNNPIQAREQWGFNHVQVRAIGDKCVEAVNGNLAVGAQLQINDCTGAAAQNWIATPTGQIKSSVNPNLCWDDPSGSNVVHTRLQLYTCNGGANQAFNFSGKGEIQVAGLCADIFNAQPTNGAAVQLYTCKADTDSSRMNQRFHFSGPLEDSGLCLDIPSAITNDLTLDQVFTCNGGANQFWDRYFPNH
jgi:hypothetical protein